MPGEPLFLFNGTDVPMQSTEKIQKCYELYEQFLIHIKLIKNTINVLHGEIKKTFTLT